MDGESIAEVLRSAGGQIRDFLVRPMFGAGSRERTEGHHDFQPKLAKPNGPRWRRLPRQPVGRSRVGSGGLHGPPERAGNRLESGGLRLTISGSAGGDDTWRNPLNEFIPAQYQIPLPMKKLILEEAPGEEPSPWTWCSSVGAGRAGRSHRAGATLRQKDAESGGDLGELEIGVLEKPNA